MSSSFHFNLITRPCEMHCFVSPCLTFVDAHSPVIIKIILGSQFIKSSGLLAYRTGGPSPHFCKGGIRLTTGATIAHIMCALRGLEWICYRTVVCRRAPTIICGLFRRLKIQ